MTTDPVNERLVKVETALMHLEHRCEQMHDSILSQQREMASLRRLLERIQTVLDRDAGSVSEVRDPADEKPPHY